MTIRFVLEVPRSEAADAVSTVNRVPDAEVTVAQNVEGLDAAEATEDLSVSAESLDVIDDLYIWRAKRDTDAPIFINIADGERYRLDAYDGPSLKHALSAHLDTAATPSPEPPVQYATSRAGNLVFEVPFGGRMSDGPALVSAESTIKLDRFDHVALRVQDLSRAERFYHSFFGMDVAYRAYREDGRWEQVDETFDWSTSIHEGPFPEIVRMENGPVAVVLIAAGMAQPVYENRIDHLSVVVTPQVLAQIRGKALFQSFTVREDGQRAFQFVDPFGLVWQLMTDESAAIAAGGQHGT
jgi:catechol 2,3-dioxygenase-like lactoylglutathione lyase family enzyme